MRRQIMQRIQRDATSTPPASPATAPPAGTSPASGSTSTTASSTSSPSESPSADTSPSAASSESSSADTSPSTTSSPSRPSSSSSSSASSSDSRIRITDTRACRHGIMCYNSGGHAVHVHPDGDIGRAGVACVEANRQLGTRGRRRTSALGRSSQLAAVPLAPPPRQQPTLPLVTSAPALSSLASAPNSARERQRRVEGAAQEDSGRTRQGQVASPAPASSNGGVRRRGGRNTDDSLLTTARAASTTATARPAGRTGSHTTAIANIASAATATISASSIIRNSNSTTADTNTAGAPTASTTTSGRTTITDVANTPRRTIPATATTTAGSTAGARTGSTPIDGGTITATTTNLRWRGESNASTSAMSKRRSTRRAAADHDGQRSPPTASSSPRTPTTSSSSVRATSGRQASTEPLAQTLAPPPPTVASTSTVFPGKWVEWGGFECGVDGCGGRSNPGALECSGCNQSLRRGWAFGVTEIKQLDEVTFRGRNGFTYTGLIVALNGSTEIFPDGSALVKHSDALYKRDRYDEDVALSCINPPGCTGGSAKRVRNTVDRLMNSSSS